MTAVWQRFVEWYLGIPPRGAGEGTQWEWQARSPWPEGWPPALGVLIAVVAVAGVAWSYRREGQLLSVRQRLVLTTLRLGALIVAWIVWMQPTLQVARSGVPPIAVLLDTSESMGLRDAGSAAATTPEGLPTTPSRWEQVRAALIREDARVLRALSERHPLKLYQFAATASSLGTSSSEGRWAEQLDRLTPTGTATRPAEGVRQVLAELRGMPPTALVVITDGIASEQPADKLSTVAEVVRRRGTQLIVVPVGKAEPPRDLQLFDVVMDEIAFVGDPVVISGKLRATGLGQPNVALKLTAKGESQPIVEQVIPVTDKDGQPEKFELSFTVDRPVEWELTLSAGPVPGETQPDNNQVTRRLVVREERLKVLLIESTPRFEFRYLKPWFERDTSVELQTLLIDADPDFLREDKTAIPYFPVQKPDLFQYDVIILGDVAPLSLGATAADWLAEFVREKGGGLILIAGGRHNPVTFRGTALEGLLPFALDAAQAAAWNQPAVEEYRPRLTLDGQKGVPLFRFGESELATMELWSRLPGFYGLLPISEVKPGVRVLLEHPYSPAKEGRLPVVLLQQVGPGKVLYHATDELWRWRFRQGDTYFGKYWGQAIRYLSRSKLLGHDRPAELLVDRQTYVQGEPVLVRVRFLDDRWLPKTDEGVGVSLERSGSGRRELTLSRLPHLPTVFETQVTGLVDGSYHAWLSRPSFEGAPPAVDFLVESQRRELRSQATDRADLQLAAKLSGGRLLELDELAALPAQLPPARLVPLEQGRAIPLWSRWEPLLLLMGLLIGEWLLRRRWRLP